MKMWYIFAIVGICASVLPGIKGQQHIYCLPGAPYECCSLPIVNESTVSLVSTIRFGTDGHAHLDVNATWIAPPSSSGFNGYAVCLQEAPYNSPLGIVCGATALECSYQATRISEFSFVDVPFEKSIYFIIRVAEWKEDGTYEYLAPKEISIRFDSPACIDVINNPSLCDSQDVPTTTPAPPSTSTASRVSTNLKSSTAQITSASKPIYCFVPGQPYHVCCDFPTINQDGITFAFVTTQGNETAGGSEWALDVIASWDIPPGEDPKSLLAEYAGVMTSLRQMTSFSLILLSQTSDFNGYGVCLEPPPRAGISGINCMQSSVDCDYQYTNQNSFVFHNVPYGHDPFLAVRVAFLNAEGTAKYLSPKEEDLQFKTPDCFEETGDAEYCRRQPISVASKPTSVIVQNVIRLDDDYADVVITWRQPIQLNSTLRSFFVKATNIDQTMVTSTDDSARIYVNETQKRNGLDTLYSATLQGLWQNSSYTIVITPYVENSTFTGTQAIIPLFIPILAPTTAAPTPNLTIITDDTRDIYMISSSPSLLGVIEIAVVVICIFIAFVITIVVIVIILSKRKEEKADETVFVRYPDESIYRKSSSRSTSMLHDIEEKEVDPVFEDIEIDRSKLKIEEELGSGQFGVVYKAFLLGVTGDKDEYIPVAVKGLKANANRAMKEDFLDEIKLIIEIRSHPNILSILGCITADEPNYLITEFMKYGDLLHFLWRCREDKYIAMDPIYRLTNITKLQIAHQIARGMDYLSKTRYYHGDLAARNILVGEDLVVKISDFGMADDIYMRGYKRLAPERKRPVKWVSLETNTKGQCSIESDVWSYGIVLYEIVTLGGVPYPNMDGRAVMDKLVEGYRMEQPEGCPNDFYDVMRKCWLENPSERPKFHTLYQTFDKMLASQSDYLPAFEFTEPDNDDHSDGKGVFNEIKLEENQDIPPSYHDSNKVDCVVNMEKKRCNSYVTVKPKDQLTPEEAASLAVMDETDSAETKGLCDTFL